ncbi:hypothetical protein TOPH_01531, partial [Tolypocladium ophioglossoides CBS 100239]
MTTMNRTETAEVQSRPLRVLSLDGGGIRGISSLLILEDIMERLRQTEGLERVPRPCKYFDLIGGTSTGGIIAIMLGRLGMSVDECIRAYKKVAQQAFTPKRTSILPASPSGAFSATQLEAAIKKTVREFCVNPVCVDQRDRSKSTTDTCPHGEMEFRDSSCCDTVVLAITKDDVDALPTLFTTYDTSVRLEGCTVWQVARATSAATTFFKQIRVGRDDIEFVDAGFGFNNPCEVLIDEAQQRFPRRGSMRILSFGTGLGDVVTIDNTRKSIIKALIQMATTSKKVALRLDGRFGDSNEYCRFNVDRGLEDITLSDWARASKISSHTQNYLAENRRAIEKFIHHFTKATSLASVESGGEFAELSSTANIVCHHIPFPRNEVFVGRKSVMNTLTQRLFGKSSIPRVALVGLGGIGKTQVALQIAYWVKDNERNCSVFWLPALSMASFSRTCADLTGKLSIQSSHNEDPKELLKTYLSSATSGNWLLIVDNADDMNVIYGPTEQSGGIDDFLPQSDNGRILFTTRSQEVAVTTAGSDVIELLEMSQKEGKAFLAKSLIRKDQLQQDDVVVELLERLTYLPLAIAQAAAYVNMKKVHLKEYLRLCKNTDQDMIELLRSKFRDKAHYSSSQGAVATTWIISFSQIRETDQLAAQLLLFIAWIEPRAIPRSILPSPASEQARTNAIGTLCGYGFLSWREDNETLDLHSLVHLAMRAWARKVGMEEACKKDVLAHICRVFPSDRWEDRELWRQQLPHALGVLLACEDIETDEYCDLGYWVGRCLSRDGRIMEAVEVLKQVMKRRETLAEDHPDRLASQHALAGAYQANGQVSEVVKILEQVVEIQKILAENYPDRLASQYALAGAYQDNGRVPEAVKILEQVVEIQKTLAE